jgi:hypothetical protein
MTIVSKSYNVQINKLGNYPSLIFEAFPHGGVMPLFTLAGSGGIHVLWKHSSIFQ